MQNTCNRWTAKVKLTCALHLSFSFPAKIQFLYSNACEQTLSNTFKEVDRVSSAVPHVNVSVHAAGGQPVPAHLHRHRIPVPRPVITVLIEPVPAVTHEVGVKTHHHLAIRRLFLPDPIKHGAEATLTHTWQTKHTQNCLYFYLCCKKQSHCDPGIFPTQIHISVIKSKSHWH